MSQIDLLSHPPFAALHRGSLWFSYLARLSQTVGLQPNKPALRWLDVTTSRVHRELPVLRVAQELSYGELWHCAVMLAAHLHDSGVAPQDRVLLVFPFTSLDFIVSFLACLLHGAVPCPTYPPDPRRFAATVPKLGHVQRVLEARHALCNAQYHKWKTLSRLQPGVRWPDKLHWITTTPVQRAAVADYQQHSELYQEAHAAIFTRAAVTASVASDSRHRLACSASLPAAVEAAYWRALEQVQASQSCPTRLAFIQQTSGSTSDPKGVMIHYQAFSNDIGLQTSNNRFIHVDRLHPNTGEPEMVVDDVRQLSWLPMYHDMGLIFGYFVPLHLRGTVHAMSPLDFMKQPTSWVVGMSQFGITMSAAPNFAYDLVVRRWLLIPEHLRPQLQLSQVQGVLNAAEAVHQSTVNDFLGAFSKYGFAESTILPSYGQAEVVVYTCFERAGRIVHNSKTPQLVSSGSDFDKDLTTIIIVKPEGADGAAEEEEAAGTTVRLCEENEVGEIWVSCAMMALGYWKDDEKTAATFHNTLPSSAPDHLRLAPNGEVRRYLATGDLGCLEAGHLFITGRRKELIIIQGRNIYPVDIEHSLLHFSNLRRGCCVALGLTAEEAAQATNARQNKKKRQNGDTSKSSAAAAELATEQLVLLAEVKDEHMKEAELQTLVDEIVAHIAAEHALKVSQVYLMPPRTLPKTTSGKLRRVALRQQLVEDKLAKAPLLVVQHAEKASGAGHGGDGTQAASGDNAVQSEPVLPRWDWSLPVEQREAVIVDSILQLVAQSSATAPKQLEPGADVELGAMGVDSMQSVTLLHTLRTHMEQSVSTQSTEDAVDDLFAPTVLYEFPSVRALARHLASFTADSDASQAPSDEHEVDIVVDANEPGADPVSPGLALNSEQQATTVAYVLCGVGQFLALTVYWFWLLLVASYAFHLISLVFSHVSLLATLAVVPLVYLAFGLSLCCSVVLVKWLLLGRVKPGRHRVWGWFFFRWWVVDRYVAWTHLVILNHLQGTTLYRAFLMSMGCFSAYRPDVLDTTGISDWDLVDLADRCVVDSDALIQPHSLQGQWLLLAVIQLGQAVHVQHRATVVASSPGCVRYEGGGVVPVLIPFPTVIEAQTVIAAGDHHTSPSAAPKLQTAIAPSTASSSPRIQPMDTTQSDISRPTVASSSLLRFSRGLSCDAFRLYAESVAVILAVIVAYQVLIRLSRAMDLLSSELASSALSWPSSGSSSSASVALAYTVLVFLVGPQWLAPFAFWLARPNLSTASAEALFGSSSLFQWYQSTLLRSHFVIQFVFTVALAYIVYVWSLAAALALWRLLVRLVMRPTAEGRTSYPTNSFVDAVQSGWAGTARRWAFSLSFVYTATSFQVWALRSFGAKVDSCVMLADTRQWEAPEKVEVGARSFIGDLSSIHTQSYITDSTNSQQPTVTHGKVCLGTDCLLGMLGDIVPDPALGSAAALPAGGLIGAGSHFGLEAQKRVQERLGDTSASSTAAVLFGHNVTWKNGDTQCAPWPIWFRVVYEVVWPLLISTCEVFMLVLSLLPTVTASLYLLDYHGFWWTAFANCALGWLYWTSVVCLVVLTKWILIGRFRAGQHQLASIFFLRRLVFNHQLAFFRAVGLDTWQNTQLLVMLYRLMGACMGSRVALNTILVTEPDLLDVGSRSSIDSRAVLFSHVVERGVMSLEHSRVGEDCVIGQRAVLLCGSRMEDGVALTYGSVAMKGQTLSRRQQGKGKASTYPNEFQGVPAVRR